MRSPILAILAIVILGAVVVPIQDSDADSPARLYFFDENNNLIKEMVLMPGERLMGDIPAVATGWAWYDDDGYVVNLGRTFDSGDYIIKAYNYANHPTPAPETPNYGLIIGIIGIVAAVIGLSAYFFIFKK